jgi:hypothetical protein
MCEQPLPDDDLQLLARVNAMDMQLYAFAEAAWRERAEYIERVTGWQLLCGSYIGSRRVRPEAARRPHQLPAAELVAQQPMTSHCAGAALWVFVSIYPQKGSFLVRGKQMAELLSQHTPTRGNETTIEAMSCEDACGAAASARFDEFLAER